MFSNHLPEKLQRDDQVVQLPDPITRFCIHTAYNGKSLPGVEVRIRNEEGQGVGDNEGFFISDADGWIELPADIPDGLYHAKVTAAPDRQGFSHCEKSVYIHDQAAITILSFLLS